MDHQSSNNKQMVDSTATVWRLYESVKDSLTKLANGSHNGDNITPGFHRIPIDTADVDIEAGLMSITPDLVENESQASGSPSSSLLIGGQKASNILQQAKITVQIPNIFSSNKSKTE